MKVRLLLILAGFAIGFTFPALAQQTNAPDPKLRETLFTFITKYGEVFNNGEVSHKSKDTGQLFVRAMIGRSG